MSYLTLLRFGSALLHCTPNVLPARVNQHVMIIRPVDGELMSYYLPASFAQTKIADTLA
jgi:hypothetical protein